MNEEQLKALYASFAEIYADGTPIQGTGKALRGDTAVAPQRGNISYATSTGHRNVSSSLSAGVLKPKVFRDR
jgi:hypothetical protein